MKLRLFIGALVSVIALVGAPGAASAEHNAQAFFINSPEGSTEATVTAVGVFDGVGQDVVIRETFDEGNNGRFSFTSRDKFVFDEGNLVVDIQGTGRITFDEEDCAGQGSGRGTYRVNRGTGLFRDARGNGTFRFDFAFTGDKVNGECVEDDGSGVFFAKLMGTLRLQGTMAA